MPVKEKKAHDLSGLAVLWDDEEPYNMRVAVEQFKSRFGWEVKTFKMPHITLDSVMNMSEEELGRTILILDIMMPAADGDIIFTPAATRDGLLTGLHVARILFEREKLQRFRAVYFYSILSSEDLIREVTRFIQNVKAKIGKNMVFEFIHKSEINFFELPEYIKGSLPAYR